MSIVSGRTFVSLDIRELFSQPPLRGAMLVRRRDAVPERPAEFEFAPIYGPSRAVERWRIIGLVMAMKHRMRVSRSNAFSANMDTARLSPASARAAITGLNYGLVRDLRDPAHRVGEDSGFTPHLGGSGRARGRIKDRLVGTEDEVHEAAGVGIGSQRADAPQPGRIDQTLRGGI
jgi:hypothetical protein